VTVIVGGMGVGELSIVAWELGIVTGVGVFVGAAAVSVTTTTVGVCPVATILVDWRQAASSPRSKQQLIAGQNLTIPPGHMAAITLTNGNQFFDTAVSCQGRNQLTRHCTQPLTKIILS